MSENKFFSPKRNKNQDKTEVNSSNPYQQQAPQQSPQYPQSNSYDETLIEGNSRPGFAPPPIPNNPIQGGNHTQPYMPQQGMPPQRPYEQPTMHPNSPASGTFGAPPQPMYPQAAQRPSSPFEGRTMVDQVNQHSVEPLLFLIYVAPRQNYGQILTVRGGVARIGRNQNMNIALYDQQMRVSDHHATIALDRDPENNNEQVFIIQDHFSTNSTFVNGQDIRGRSVILHENDLVRIVDFEFVVKTLGLSKANV